MFLMQISEHVQEKIADLRNRLGAQEIRERVLGKISKLQNWPRTPEIRERVQGKIADLRKSLGAQASSLRAHFDSIVDRFSGFAPAAQTSSISDVRQELAKLESWLMSVEAEVYSLKEQFDSVIEKPVDASAEREDAVESVTSEFVDASDMMESVKDEE